MILMADKKQLTDQEWNDMQRRKPHADEKAPQEVDHVVRDESIPDHLKNQETYVPPGDRVESASELTEQAIRTQQDEVVESGHESPGGGQAAADPNARVTLQELPRSEDSIQADPRPPSLDEDIPLFIVKGDVRVDQAKRLMLEPHEKRGWWWSATYVDKFDITLVQFKSSIALHNIRESELFKGWEDLVQVDYEQMPTTNLDDLHFLDQKLGTL